MKKIALVFIAFWFFLAAKAQETHLVLEGAIAGKYPIVMSLDSYDGDCQGSRYFYKKTLLDILLDGKLKDGVLKLNSTDNFQNPGDEKFDLKRQKDGSWKGTWSKGTKKLAVVLRSTNVNDYKHPFDYLEEVKKMKTEMAYNYVRTSLLTYTQDSVSEFQGHKLRWWKEKRADVGCFRIESGYDKKILDKMNVFLDNLFFQAVNGYYNCIGDENYEFSSAVTPQLMNDDVISLSEFSSYYCGGAHPDFGETGYSFDVKTGKELKIEDILWFGEGTPPAEDNSDFWYQYNEQVFNPKIVEILLALYPDSMQDPESGCDYVNDGSVWSPYNWHLSEGGLYIGAYFYRAARVCDNPEWSYIPYDVVRKYTHAKIKVKLP